MDDAEREIDWSVTTWEGSRCAQLRHALCLTLRERLEAAEGLADVMRRLREMREQGLIRALRPDAPASPAEQVPEVREPAPSTAATNHGAAGTGSRRGGARYAETRLGVLTYFELAPHLAGNVLALEERVEDGEFSRCPLDDALLLRFHDSICGDLVPQLSGWRRVNLAIGDHEPPKFFRVPVLVREYGRDLEFRLSAGGGVDETLLEALAFAEGRLLFIHPFADFNGRVTRVWLRECLRRLDLPPVQLAPMEEPRRGDYLAALRAADRSDWRPLMEIWRERFERDDAT